MMRGGPSADQPAGFGKHGKYRVLVALGTGGFAEVYLTIARGPVGVDKLVVIKKLKAELALDTSFLIMFVDEARLAARLNHPNVVQTYEVVEEARDCFIAMEYLEGQPLNRLLAEVTAVSEWLDPFVCCRIVADALTGLHYAHELTDLHGRPLRVIHRDVSPHNIFVTYDGLVKVMDFGLAKASDNLTRTEVGIIKGKLSYMPPEQLRGHDLDRRADIFAMGVVLWELLAQQRMRIGPEDPTAFARERSPRVRTARPDIDVELDAIVGKALEAKPDDRYATAKEMRDAIDGYIASKGRAMRQEDLGEPVRRLFAAQRADLQATVQSRLSLMMNETKPGGGADGGVLARAVAQSFKPAPTPPPARSAPPPLPKRASMPTQPGRSTPPPAPLVHDPAAPFGVPVLPLQTSSRTNVRMAVAIGVASFVVAIVGIGAAFLVVSRSETEGPPSGSSPTRPPPSTSEAVSAAAVPTTTPPPPAEDACPADMARIGGGGSCLDRNEVTVEKYRACTEKRACAPASPTNDWPGIKPVDHELFDGFCTIRPGDAAHPMDTHPINCVDWQSAAGFCEAQGKRLPTDAEWELAARGKEGRKYPWGDAAPGPRLVNACGDECGRWKRARWLKLFGINREDLAFLVQAYPGDDGWVGTAPVGSFAASATPEGVTDLAGNVGEWVSDWFGAETDPRGPAAGSSRVVRGGAFTTARSNALVATFRQGEPPAKKSYAIGFRCAKRLGP